MPVVIAKDVNALRRAARLSLIALMLLWSIRLLESALGLDLARFGVYPHDLGALAGILWAPLIHGSFSHLFANSLPLLVLGTAALHGYPRAARLALPLIYLLSGAGVWLFAREAYHIGASGFTHGLMFFVFLLGVLRRDRASIAWSLLVFLLYGGMVWGIFPREPGISYEYHFFGALTGAVLAVLLRNRDPRSPTRRYDWEQQDDQDDPLIGDAWREPPSDPDARVQ